MGKWKIGVVYNEPVSQGKDHWEASMDILTQVESVEKALASLGYPSVRIPFTKNLEAFLHRMKDEGVDVAFNLCETVDEDPGFAWHPAAVLELLGIPFSGSPSAALMLTTDKLLAKGLMLGHGVDTPRYLEHTGQEAFNAAPLRFPVIVKPRFEDASVGIDQESIFKDEETLQKALKDFRTRFGALVVEEYIEGREFNVSLLGHPRAEALPVAEIEFSDFPEGLYPIVGYRAKWEKDSFEFSHTPRLFPEDLPDGLLKELNDTALRCFDLFQLRDYGRVDLRVDARAKVYALEVNANPCLSPDAGLAAASREKGMTYDDLVGELVAYAVQRMVKDDHQASRVAR